VSAEQRYKNPSGPRLKTAMVQGNVSLQRKHDVSFFTVNQEQYLKTSAQVAEKDLLIIWPESTITKFIPTSTAVAYHALDRDTGEPLLPFLNNGSAFLVGGLTYRSRAEFFNSSILIRPDGSLDTPYNKMILMPFGEYTPFSSWLPWLEEINSTAAQFTAGAAPAVLSFPLSSGVQAKLSPLICYEDVVPQIAREATQLGAELLINQTNDAWFGRTVAPYQHHMIASWRAIENRRYLLRSTNTGLTAVVDPLGRTAASLLPFTEGVLPLDVELLSEKTLYTSMPIYALWLFVAALCVLLAVLPRRAR
jgi:apolipoprotein N-acyltransferase